MNGIDINTGKKIIEEISIRLDLKKYFKQIILNIID